MLATPCAMSSMFERWRPPIMPSDTTADSSDSIPASSAIVNAGLARLASRGSVTSGSAGRGSPASITPNRLPIVSTGRWNSCTIAVVTTRATSVPGIRLSKRRHTTMIANVSVPTPRAHGLSESMWRASASYFWRNGPGTVSISRPSRSRIWVEKMIDAMPVVKPMVTG